MSAQRSYNLATRNNYRGLKEIAMGKKKLKLVCVQYPLQSIEPLKRIFQRQEGIIFVDNEYLFKEAIQKTNYKDYFIDMFAGDFGHCSDRGNELLAKNIASAILKEVFGYNGALGK